MPEITYATVCSGIECMSEAVRPLGCWRPVFFSEIEPFPCAVLKSRHPAVQNLGDMKNIRAERVSADKWRITNGADVIELAGRLGCLAGGTPCTDVSIAGRREGMAEGSGTRSSLAFEFARLCRELEPRWVLWENVPGVLTSNGGRDFAQFLDALGECGYSVAYRTLDAQYTRVDGFPGAIPQRRRRVWVVAHLGADDLAAAEVLLEPARACGDTPPRRVAGAEAAGFDVEGCRIHGRVVDAEPDGREATVFTKVNHASGRDGLGERWAEADVASTRNTFEIGDVRSQEVVVAANAGGCAMGMGRDVYNCGRNARFGFGVGKEVQPTLTANTDAGAVCVLNFQGSKSNNAVTADGASPTLTAGHGTDAHVIVADRGRAMSYDGYNQRGVEEVCHTLRAAASGGEGDDATPKVAIDLGSDAVAAMRYIVRRITPTEAERLMGLPDGYTLPSLAVTDGLVCEFAAICTRFSRIKAEFEGRRPPKPRTERQTRKWLERISDPATCPDSLRYRVCGNGWAVNCARWVCGRITQHERKEKSE